MSDRTISSPIIIGPESSLGKNRRSFRFFAIGEDKNSSAGTNKEIFQTEESHDPQEVGRDAAREVYRHAGARTIQGTKSDLPFIDVVFSDGVVHEVSFYKKNAIEGTRPFAPSEADWTWVIRGWNSIANRRGLSTLSIGQANQFISGELDDRIIQVRDEDPQSEAEGLVIGYARGLSRLLDANAQDVEPASAEEFTEFERAFTSALSLDSTDPEH